MRSVHGVRGSSHVKWLVLFAVGTLLVGLLVHFHRTPRDSAIDPHVLKNQLVDGRGEPLQLRGVNRSGTEFACVKGKGIFDGPYDVASLVAMRKWSINAVRIPLNEGCWLGGPGISPRLSGPAYRTGVLNYVSLLNDEGIVAVLDLHWSAPRGLRPDQQRVMPDADNSPIFWGSVAETFAPFGNVLFEVYNEPHDISWSCWRDGCLTQTGWRAAGMQELVDAIRQAGAKQPVILGGLNWANDLSGWLAHRPRDPEGQLVAGFHAYPHMSCGTRDCWERVVAALARSVPVVTTEVGGEPDCSPSEFVQSFTSWADARDISWLVWTWNAWRCSNYALISSYDGTPTPYGEGVKELLLNRQGSRDET